MGSDYSVVAGTEMVMNADTVDLIEELLLGCAPGPDLAQRGGIAMSVLRSQDHETALTLASWFLGGLAGALSVNSAGDPVVYRRKVSEAVGRMRA